MKRLLLLVIVLLMGTAIGQKTPRVPPLALSAKSITIFGQVDRQFGKPEDEEQIRQVAEQELLRWGRYKVITQQDRQRMADDAAYQKYLGKDAKYVEPEDLVLVVYYGINRGGPSCGLALYDPRRMVKEKWGKPIWKYQIQGTHPVEWALRDFEEAIDHPNH
jgi:hypothetical protein